MKVSKRMFLFGLVYRNITTGARSLYGHIRARNYIDAYLEGIALCAWTGGTGGLATGTVICFQEKYKDPIKITETVLSGTALGVTMGIMLGASSPVWFMFSPIIVPICVYNNFVANKL